MVYEPPTRATFKATLQRALRDPNGQVFPSATLSDFIDEALMDMSSYRPNDVIRGAPWTPDTWYPPVEVYEDISDIWQVVAREDDLDARKNTLYIPHADYADGRAGWDFVPPTQFRITRIWVYRLQEWAKRAPALILRIYGYGFRHLPTSDSSYLDFHSPIDQYCALQHCKFLGFQMLNADRALYQQWLAATNNTDVSPTQLQGMLGQAEATYDRVRQRSTIIRRRPTNADAVAF